MPIMTLDLALLLVVQFAALQFPFRHRENLLHGLAEFLGRIWLGRCCLHVATLSLHALDRKTYTTDVPTAMMIKSVRINRAQSIRDVIPDSVNRNA